MSAESAGEEEEGDLEHHWKTLDEEVQWPFLQSIAFALTVSATLDHRPARIPQVSIQPLLAQHGDECGEQGDHETRIHETGHCDDLARWVLLGKWNGRSVNRDGRLIESEEDRAEEGGGLFVRIGSEVRMGIDDEGGADGREQTSLQEQVRWPTRADDRWRATHKNQGGVEVLVVLLDVVHIVLGRLPLVHGVEVDAGIIGLDGLEERSQGVLEATSSQCPATQTMEGANHTPLDRFAAVGIPFRSFRSFQHSP